MKDYIKIDEWKIIEDQYVNDHNQITESLLSLGNGQMGQRANFEEDYSGPTLQGSYVAGVYYPDKTRVGWWKNGYPEYFAKVLNSCNWIGLNIFVGDEILDLNRVKEIKNFYRELDMKNGVLYRKMEVVLQNGAQLNIESQRITSMANKELGTLRYSISVTGFQGTMTVIPYLDFDVVNEDSNYDEKFWTEVEQVSSKENCYVSAKTLKTNYIVGVAMEDVIRLNGSNLTPEEYSTNEKYGSKRYTFQVNDGDKIVVEKYCGIASTMYHDARNIQEAALVVAKEALEKGFDQHISAHSEAWAAIWDMCDIEIKGDASAQQGIRFNIFQLYQTYTGHDDRLNIGPKGFTGEKYGGSTYWDTEAYCLPFYMSTADQSVARNLLIYRYKQLGKAIENAEKLGFKHGAALYPMVTMNGEECHNEWEITFEEIHRNGAIAYAIFDYIQYTGDKDYLAEYGLEVLIAIARFWKQRVNWSEQKNKYVMLGVTGPNEYENNVNNNWYTNYIATWCMEYALECIVYVSEQHANRYEDIVEKIKFLDEETKDWQDIIENIYFPEDTEKGIFLQQDNYLDKEQLLVDDLAPEDRPLNQKWSWDRILRSCFIKQADVLQGLYFFENDFDEATHRSNFLFYEPRTVHESSLSPCVHSILASKLGMEEKAYEMYLRTSRLDLNDYNNDTEDGCHITSMAGTWLSIVKGFGGQRVIKGHLSLNPFLPKNWEKLTFKIKFRANLFKVSISSNHTHIENLEGPETTIFFKNEEITVPSNSKIELS